MSIPMHLVRLRWGGVGWGMYRSSVGLCFPSGYGVDAVLI